MATALKPRFTRRILLFVGIGLAILVLYLYYFIGTVNIAVMIRQTNLFYYALAFVVFLASVLFYSLAWHSLLHDLNIEAKISEVLLFAWAGMFFDAVVPDPGWSGDLSKAYMLSKASGQDAGRIVASVVSQKIIAAALTVGALIFGLVLLALNYTLPGDVLIFVVIVLSLTIFSLGAILYLSANDKATGRILNWLIRAAFIIRRGRWDPLDFRIRAEQMLSRFHEGIRNLSAKPRALARPILFSLLSWGSDISITLLTFASLGHPVPLDKVLIVYALTGSMQAMGISFLGFTEVVMSSAYTLLGMPLGTSALATLLVRVVTLWFKLIVSYGVFQWAGIKLLLGKGQEAKTNPPNVDSFARSSSSNSFELYKKQPELKHGSKQKTDPPFKKLYPSGIGKPNNHDACSAIGENIREFECLVFERKRKRKNYKKSEYSASPQSRNELEISKVPLREHGTRANAKRTFCRAG